MKIATIREIARQQDFKLGRASKSELVRSIRQAEGNQLCYAINLSAGCVQHSSIWREDCD